MSFQALDRKFGVIPNTQILKEIREEGWFASASRRGEPRLFYVMKIDGKFFPLRIEGYSNRVAGVDVSRVEVVHRVDNPNLVLSNLHAYRSGIVSGEFRRYTDDEVQAIESRIQELNARVA